jgi:hypothetical protein
MNDELNLSICSYNIYWENMVDRNLKLNKKNLLSNIYYVHNYYNPDIYCFQEVVNHELILQIFDKRDFDSFLGFSNPEYILTIWNKHKLDKIFIKEGEFEPGRPFTIILFYDKIRNYYFILINIHAGHYVNTKQTIFQPINIALNDMSFFIKKYNVNRIIIVGDFNRDISEELDDNINIKVLNKNFTFKANKNNNKTCCSLKGYGHKYNYDHVIDSYNSPIITKSMKMESWYKNPSSDHIMIISVMKNII